MWVLALAKVASSHKTTPSYKQPCFQVGQREAETVSFDWMIIISWKANEVDQISASVSKIGLCCVGFKAAGLPLVKVII